MPVTGDFHCIEVHALHLALNQSYIRQLALTCACSGEYKTSHLEYQTAMTVLSTLPLENFTSGRRPYALAVGF